MVRNVQDEENDLKEVVRFRELDVELEEQSHRQAKVSSPTQRPHQKQNSPPK